MSIIRTTCASSAHSGAVLASSAVAYAITNSATYVATNGMLRSISA
ncbi:hypothetical protein [Sandaracinus amylolyticus]|nr:hypothetical protein [Sandaracinus amylolyticus]